MEQNDRDNLSKIYLSLTTDLSTHRAEIAVLQAQQVHMEHLLAHYATREITTDHEGRLKVVEAALNGYKKLCYALILAFLLATATTVWQAVQKVERIPISQGQTTGGRP